MDRRLLFTLAEDIINGYTPDIDEYKALAAIEEQDVFSLFAGADMIRDFHFGREIHLCCICNGKSGKCSEDCSFCSQSAFARTDVPVYPLMGKSELQQGGLWALNTPITRYSIVTSGKRLPKKEVASIAEALAELDGSKISTCASLGILDSLDFETLKKAGVSRYHHNLETAQSHFSQMCTTHTYQERIDTIMAAKEAGLSVCSGGVFGIKENDKQVLELALTLKDLDVDAVPLNFLVPIKGTKTENHNELSPLRCLKIISIFRYVLPKKDIFVCGGREYNLKELHPLIFYAGASGMMTGDYLTTSGRTLETDLALIEQLGFVSRAKF
ncbi:MAG: biotin synthase BioB [Chloroflexi bacterium]|nr:biotin synthase BioB [Chloroflexota bacterium]